MADAPRVVVFAFVAVAFACWWGPRVALASDWNPDNYSRSYGHTYQASNGTWVKNMAPNGPARLVNPTAYGTGATAGAYGTGSYAGAAGYYGQSGVLKGPPANLPVTLKAPVTVPAAAAAAARGLVKLLPYAAAAYALYDLAESAGIIPCIGSNTWCTEDPNAGSPGDHSVPPYPTYSTQNAASASLPIGSKGVTYTGGGGGYISCWKRADNQRCQGGDGEIIANWPASWQPATYLRANFYQTGGGCPSGYTLTGTVCLSNGTPVPLPAEPEMQVNGMAPLLYSNIPTYIAEHGAELITIGEVPDFSEPEVTGAASVSGSQSTTTNPDGTQQVTSTTYNNTYNNSTVTTTTTTTVVNKDALGNVVDTTTTEGEPASDSQNSLCALFPDILACVTVGEVPEPELMPSETGDVDSIDPVTVGGAAVCPSPVAINLGSQGSYELSWQPACDVAEGVRPVIIGLAWLASAMIVFGVRGGVTD